nr:hypothetical protein [Micromonospora sp. DSM 115978]
MLAGVDQGIPARADAAPAPDATGPRYVLTPRGYLEWIDPDQRPPPGTVHAEHQCQPKPQPLTLF